MISDRLGPMMEMDLFVTRFSARLPRFNSWRPDQCPRLWTHFFRIGAQAWGMHFHLGMASSASRDACRFSSFTASRAYYSRAISKLRLSGGKENSTTSRVQIIRMRLKIEGISNEAVDLIMASWRRQTLTITQHGESGKNGVPTRCLSLCCRSPINPEILCRPVQRR